MTTDQTKEKIARSNAARSLAVLVTDTHLSSGDIAAITDAVRHAPAGVAAAGRALALGGALRGTVGPSIDQSSTNHVEHARDHIMSAVVFPDATADTGLLEVAHAAARCLLAVELVMGARR